MDGGDGGRAEAVESWSSVRLRIRERQADLRRLQREEEALDLRAEREASQSQEALGRMLCLLRRHRDDLCSQVRARQESEVTRVEELLDKLQWEIQALEGLLRGEAPPGNAVLPGPVLFPAANSGPACPPAYFQGVTEALLETRLLLLDLLKDRWSPLLQTDPPQGEPDSRAGFLRFWRRITLDPDTANTRLLLSEQNRRVTNTRWDQAYPPHPARFCYDWQVLGREVLTGRCYWEVAWSGWRVCVAVAYGNIHRVGHGNESVFGLNPRSWALDCFKRSYKFWHDQVPAPVSGPRSSRVGVYLDHGAGLLCFYDVSDTMTLLHRVRTSFAQPLYAGLGVYYSPGAMAELVQLPETDTREQHL